MNGRNGPYSFFIPSAVVPLGVTGENSWKNKHVGRGGGRRGRRGRSMPRVVAYFSTAGTPPVVSCPSPRGTRIARPHLARCATPPPSPARSPPPRPSASHFPPTPHHHPITPSPPTLPPYSCGSAPLPRHRIPARPSRNKPLLDPSSFSLLLLLLPPPSSPRPPSPLYRRYSPSSPSSIFPLFLPITPYHPFTHPSHPTSSLSSLTLSY